MASLLIHSDTVPQEARAALDAARSAPPDRRRAHLEVAARVLHRETPLSCSEVHDLLDIRTSTRCC